MIQLGTIRLDKEDRKYLNGLSEIPMSYYGVVSIPDEIGVDDIKDEDQGQIGSCQGNAITSVVERTLKATKKAGTQLSRIFAYLATQKLDGLLGSDQGSTISNGAKVALAGIPTEADVPYPSPVRYPNRAEINQILSPENYAKGVEYAAKSLWQVPQDVDRCIEFIAGGGAISIGILWYRGIIPADRVIRKFSPPLRSGGHAVAVLGYSRRGNIVMRFKNSHGHEDQTFMVTPDAYMQMLRHRWTAAVGLMGTTEPVPVDWYNNSPLFLE